MKYRCLLCFVIIIISSCTEEMMEESIYDVGIIDKFKELYATSYNNDAFIFFTDSHCSSRDSYFYDYIAQIECYYKNSPVTFCVCGGDWLNNMDTKDEALSKLEFIDRTLNNIFPFCYFPVLGNHDTNYQGRKDLNSPMYSGTLSYKEINSTIFKRFDKSYYAFNTNSAKYFVLDSGIDWIYRIDDYRNNQINWFCENLLKNNKENLVVFLHIYQNEVDIVHPYSKIFMDIAIAFNNRSNIELNGDIVDFSSTFGRIAFFMCGHLHSDFIDNTTSIPVIGTTHFKENNSPTFDLCMVDWEQCVLYTLRVGSGASRQIKLSNL